MHVYITGASSGIGESIAREYLRRGVSVTMVARRRNLLEKIANEAGGNSFVVEQDLTDIEHVTDPIAEAELELGPIDVLINNAGFQIVQAAIDTPWADGENLIRLNVLAPLKLTQHMLPKMMARRSGTIVDVASMAGIAPTPGMFFYNASKGALACASEGLRAEVKPFGIHIVTVYPGPVESPMEARGRAAYEETFALRMTPTGKSDVLAKMIANAVEHKRPRVIYPRIYGLSRHFPNLTRWLVDLSTPQVKALPEKT
ncbi:MAG: SDR family NAD(P)-dependent oxidoreductase [Polyangiaceae bacterium]